METSRYIVGIDLGTTNSVVYYADTEQKPARIRHFPVLQLIAPGETDHQALLPSFCYLPAGADANSDVLRLPWDETPTVVVGRMARDHGAAMVGRQIASAKSWLAHAGVDRTQPILPWGGTAGDDAKSPVAVTALFLNHVREAWNHRFGATRDRDGSPCLLENQQVVVTIPASFDETARELTLAAAREAGFGHLQLLEEPLAAFYAWLNRQGPAWRETLEPGAKVLIVDVGGGTTDFSFVEMDRDGALHRFAVGEHLLLGGDNIDIALARTVEKSWNTKLGPGDWASLCQLCRQAKEAILGDGKASHRVDFLAPGSSVIGGMRTAEVRREQLLELLENGFYPDVPADAPPCRKGAGMREMGLPYASEPAVTRHLLDFLRLAAKVAARLGNAAADRLYPDHILFNGGSMIPAPVRERILSIVGGWFPDRETPRELAGEDYSRAVSVGAVYYGLVRRGVGVKVRGGIANAFFIKAAGLDGGDGMICLMSRDTDENDPTTVPRPFRLWTNQRVRFMLYRSATRLADAPGDLIEASDELSPLAPMVTVLQYGKAEKRLVDVSVVTTLTEIGTLDIRLVARDTDHAWPLRFDLRATSTDRPAAPEAVIVPAASVEAAGAVLRRAFETEQERLPKLVGELEQVLEVERGQWSVPLLRGLADRLLELREQRAQSPRHEARWLNLLGYCLRPGIGDPADRYRVRLLWQQWFQGPCFGKQVQIIAEWWILWRRVAAGLSSGHQGTVANNLFKTLMPKGVYRAKLREGAQAQAEMWRCLGALELLSLKQKRRVGQVLLDRGRNLQDFELWVLARLGARRPFHAPANAVVAPDVAARWVTALTALEPRGNNRSMLAFAVSRIAARCGDRALDLPPAAIEAAGAFLEQSDCPDSWRQRVTELCAESAEEQARLLGDTVPLGLVLADDAAP